MQVSETIENIVDIYNGNEEIHLIEEEENRNMFADVVRRFGELFKSIAGLETSDKDFYLTYIDIVIMIVFILSVFFLFFIIYVIVSYCRRKITTKKIQCLLNLVEGSTTLALDPAPSAGSASTPATSPARDTWSFLTILILII